MASQFSRLHRLLLFGASTSLILLLILDGAKCQCNSTAADLEALVPPYLSRAAGDPVTSIKVYFPKIGLAELGTSYNVNLTQDTPTVLIQSTALVADQYYTLITVDPIEPQNMSLILHYLVINIPGYINSSQDVASVGEVVETFAGPMPPNGSGIHRYMFLLFPQLNGNISVPSPADPHRQTFSLRNFGTQYHLGFVLGGFFFRVEAQPA